MEALGLPAAADCTGGADADVAGEAGEVEVEVAVTAKEAGALVGSDAPVESDEDAVDVGDVVTAALEDAVGVPVPDSL